MTRVFINSNFLLENESAKKLYHEFAENLPLIDFHNHINPNHLADNSRFQNLTRLWITEDPYKHRAMRICGLPEDSITGKVTDKQKFLNWAATLSKTVGNPLFHWSCLELKRTFGIDEILSENNAMKIWDKCNEKLQGNEFGALDILNRWNIDLMCTSDLATDDLIPHKRFSIQSGKIKLLPSLRGDSLLAVDSALFLSDLAKISVQTGQVITSLEEYQTAVKLRLDFFRQSGCQLSDHSLDSGFSFKLPTIQEATKIFQQVLKEQPITENEVVLLQSYLLKFLGGEYNRLGWMMQLHIGAHRFTSTRLRKLVGPAGGYACIGKACEVDSLVRLFDTLEQENSLPKIILYTLNPVDNEVFASLTGSFSQDGVIGKIQFGPAWWQNDHYDGITKHLITLSGYSLLSQFIGMTTDSRSILSFSRHEYFRRILCNLLGKWMEQGVVPDDFTLIGQIIKDISYYNAKRWMSNI